MIRRIAILTVLLGLTTGCQPPTPAQPTQPDKPEVHIRTPRVNVDVQGKGKGRGAEVDVNRKDQ